MQIKAWDCNNTDLGQYMFAMELCSQPGSANTWVFSVSLLKADHLPLYFH